MSSLKNPTPPGSGSANDRTPLETATDSLRKVLELVHIEPSNVEQFESEMAFVLSTYADHRVRAEVSSLESRNNSQSEMIGGYLALMAAAREAGVTFSWEETPSRKRAIAHNERAESLEVRLQAVTEAARKLCDKVAIQHEEASTMDARVELQALLVKLWVHSKNWPTERKP
jgi:hypothetical protein